MVQIFNDVRYLSAAQLAQLGLTMAQIIDILEAAFRAKAECKVMMPPKILTNTAFTFLSLSKMRNASVTCSTLALPRSRPP